MLLLIVGHGLLFAVASLIAEHRLSSCGVGSVAPCRQLCRILPDQGSNLCALHWQTDSQPLNHQESLNLQF